LSKSKYLHYNTLLSSHNKFNKYLWSTTSSEKKIFQRISKLNTNATVFINWMNKQLWASHYSHLHLNINKNSCNHRKYKLSYLIEGEKNYLHRTHSFSFISDCYVHKLIQLVGGGSQSFLNYGTINRIFYKLGGRICISNNLSEVDIKLT